MKVMVRSLWPPPHAHIISRTGKQSNNTRGSSGTVWVTAILDRLCQREANKNTFLFVDILQMLRWLRTFPYDNKLLPLKIFCVPLDTSVVSEIASTRSKSDKLTRVYCIELCSGGPSRQCCSPVVHIGELNAAMHRLTMAVHKKASLSWPC